MDLWDVDQGVQWPLTHSVDPGSLWQLILRRTSAVLRKSGAAWPQNLAVDVSGCEEIPGKPSGSTGLAGIKTWILMIAFVDLLNMFMAWGDISRCFIHSTARWLPDLWFLLRCTAAVAPEIRGKRIAQGIRSTCTFPVTIFQQEKPLCLSDS